MFNYYLIPSGASAQSNAYTEGNWYVHINDLNCTGEEKSIWDCPQNGLSGYSCYHYQDASVICQCKCQWTMHGFAMNRMFHLTLEMSKQKLKFSLIILEFTVTV